MSFQSSRSFPLARTTTATCMARCSWKAVPCRPTTPASPKGWEILIADRKQGKTTPACPPKRAHKTRSPSMFRAALSEPRQWKRAVGGEQASAPATQLPMGCCKLAAVPTLTVGRRFQQHYDAKCTANERTPTEPAYHQPLQCGTFPENTVVPPMTLPATPLPPMASETTRELRRQYDDATAEVETQRRMTEERREAFIRQCEAEEKKRSCKNGRT